jgi:predicted nucleic acid-binding protein
LLKGLSIVVIQSWEKTRLKVVLSVSPVSEFSETVKLDELRAQFRVRSIARLRIVAIVDL